MRVEESPWSPLSPAVTAAELPQVLTTHSVVVLHFWAVWDGNDRLMDAKIQAVRPHYADRIVFYAMDVDLESNWPLLQHCQLLNIPAIACFIHGSWLETSIGLRTIEQMHATLQGWLETASSRQ